MNGRLAEINPGSGVMAVQSSFFWLGAYRLSPDQDFT